MGQSAPNFSPSFDKVRRVVREYLRRPVQCGLTHGKSFSRYRHGVFQTVGKRTAEKTMGENEKEGITLFSILRGQNGAFMAF